MSTLLCFFTLLSLSSSQINDFQTICQAGIRQDNSNYIHCARKQLKEIPNFTRITNTFYDELVLNDNHITEIPSHAFQGLRVKRLNLSGNKLRSIAADAFVELSNYLEELIIEFDPDAIFEIPEAIRINLINLRSLKLIDLNLSHLKDRSFSKFRKLESLSIIKSNLHSLEPHAFSSLTSLRYLNLDQNQLNDSSWDSMTKYLPQLEVLSLSQNQFNSLRRTNITTLKSLDLSSNGLQYIDSNIFHALEKLHLQNNELNSLQLTFLFSLKNLTELNLDFNRLTFLPEKIFQWNANLRDLSLQGNDLNYLTSYSLFGLEKLHHLNLARNRLQFSSNSQPFQHLQSLKILNLDRNAQMNATANIFRDLSSSLMELSLQNCNLTVVNYSLNFFAHLQRLKLSSNYLRELPTNFLGNSLVAVDLQRNLFTSVPRLSSASLIDVDLSSNRITTLNEDDLRAYSNLKTIGLTGNPLECNCHLRWIKQWLRKNYDQDLVKFLQWTCATPQHLRGKQLIGIAEKDMLCNGNTNTERETTAMMYTTVEIPLTSIETTRMLPSTTEPSSSNDISINDVALNPNGLLTISWESRSSRSARYYHLQIYDQTNHQLIFQRFIDSRQRSMEIDLSLYFSNSPVTAIVCLNIRQTRSCRTVVFQPDINVIKSAPLVLSSNKQNNDQFVYLFGGILLGAILVCSILIIVCYCRLCYDSDDRSSSPTGAEKSSKPFYYHPLNVISYPPPPSNNTSECSLHSSIDTTSQVVNDPYHVYQQIPSVHNCQIHSTRTHVLV